MTMESYKESIFAQLNWTVYPLQFVLIALWLEIYGRESVNGASYTVNQTCFVVRSSVTKNHLKQTRGELIGGVKFIYLLRR